MKIHSGLRHLIGAAGALSLLAGLGCAQAGSGGLQLRWPDPPLVTRIEHVRTISGPWDLDRQVSPWTRFTNFLFGRRERMLRIGQPSDLTVSPDGQTLYISDFAQGVVHVYDFTERSVRYIGKRQRLSRPFGLALDSAGNLYIAEQALRQIRVVGPAGQTVRLIRSDRLIRPAGLALDEARGRLYVADASRQKSTEHFVRIFDLEGNYRGELGKGKGMGEGWLMFPSYLALDAAGRVYVSDTMNARISVFEPDGTFVRTIGTRGDGFGMFDKPKGLAFDSFGNLYVVDSSWSNVQIFGPDGDVLLYFGGRGGHPGLLRNPTDIAIAAGVNRIFVGDYLNHRFHEYQLVNTQAGDGLPKGRGQGPSKSQEGTHP